MKRYVLLIMLIAICSTAYAQRDKSKLNENPVLIGQERSYDINKEKLKQDPVLRMPEANKDYHIVSYQISCLTRQNGNNLIGPFIVQGDRLDKGKAALVLSKIQPGDRIYFEDIVAESNDANKRPINLSALVNVQ